MSEDGVNEVMEGMRIRVYVLWEVGVLKSREGLKKE